MAYQNRGPEKWYIFCFLWFQGMVFGKALSTILLNNFLVTLLLEDSQVKLKELCTGQTFPNK